MAVQKEALAMYRSVLGFLCAIGVASTAANATNLQTDAPAQASFTVVGFVPVTCRASLDATVETIIGGDVSLGNSTSSATALRLRCVCRKFS
jgi:hypothetical protein